MLEDSLMDRNQEEAHVVVRFSPKNYFWFGVGTTAFIASLMVFGVGLPVTTTAQLGLDAMLSPWLFLGVWQIADPLVSKIQVPRNEDYFIYTTWLGRDYKIRYDSIVSISDGTIWHSPFVVRTAKKRFRIDAEAENLGFFRKMLKEKAPSIKQLQPSTPDRTQ